MLEIGRISHNGLNYIVSDEKVMYSESWIPYIVLSLTKKSSNRFRNKKLSSKTAIHFDLIKVKEPIKLYNKIYKVLDNYLKDFDCVIFHAHEDDRDRRSRVYEKILSKMGFKHRFDYVDKRYKLYDTIICRHEPTSADRAAIRAALHSTYFY